MTHVLDSLALASLAALLALGVLAVWLTLAVADETLQARESARVQIVVESEIRASEVDTSGWIVEAKFLPTGPVLFWMLDLEVMDERDEFERGYSV